MSRLAGPVKTFSVGFADAGFSELEPARQVAALLGTEHHELVVEPDVVPLVEDFAWFLDEPFGDTSAIPTFMVNRSGTSRFMNLIVLKRASIVRQNVAAQALGVTPPDLFNVRMMMRRPVEPDRDASSERYFLRLA